ncbi:MAG: restriction endonuclease subunit S [Candidatus Enterosoma sp.]|nr:restriction endonuclease subunit S [Candidatus Enterosoma sp.]
MALNYKKLGEFLRLTDERNSDLSITNLQGVSISKQFIPSIANIIGTDLSSYKIVRKGQFAYGPVTSRNGDKVSIALLESDDCIISSSYLSFEVVDKTKLDPEYLMLWFMRPEFDRYARFMSNGSAREIFDWECMCGVELPVPSIEEQRKIVHDYKVISDRIELLKKINEDLEKTLSYSFNESFEPLSFDMRGDRKLSALLSFDNGYAFSSDDYLENGLYKIITIGNVGDGFVDTSKVNFFNNVDDKILNNYLLKIGDIVISLTGNVGRTALIKEENLLLNQRVARVVPKNKMYHSFIYCLFRQQRTKEYLEGISKGTAQLNLSPVELLETQINYIDEDIYEFAAKTAPILKSIINYSKEISSLSLCKNVLLTNLSKEVG